jgi:hypothetical protein
MGLHETDYARTKDGIALADVGGVAVHIGARASALADPSEMLVSIEVRAVHTGECDLIDGKIGGIGVAIGARIGASAGASEVLVSSTVKDLTAGSGLMFEDAGEHELKGVPDHWRLFRVTS